MQKKVLMMASRPLANDGITKIEMDVIRTMHDAMTFEVACGFGFQNVYGDELRASAISCHDLPNKKNPFSYMASIYRLVKREKYDSVYIHGNSAMMFLEAIPARLAHARVVTHCHNTKSDFPLVHYLMKPVFNCFVDLKIGCSSLASKWAYCGKHIVTVPNGIETEKFRFDGSIRKLRREELGWEDAKIVGHMGRFSKQKNHSRLLAIFDEMHRMDASTRLLLIGDGELLEDVKKDIAARGLHDVVRILEFTDRPQDYMQAMDVMIIPSLFEGFCLVAVEAQANGLPVLIDQYFPAEASVTEQALKLDLSLPDETWARQGLEMIKKGRVDGTKQIREKKLDQKDMMEAIRQILLEKGGSV